MPQLKFYLFGPPRIDYDNEAIDVKRRKALALVLYLAVEGQQHSRSALATMFWPEYDQSNAFSVLRTTLAALRRTPLNDWLDVDRKTVRLRHDDNVWVDVKHFHALLEQCPPSESSSVEENGRCIQVLSEAVGLYQAEFLRGFTLPDSPAFDEWQFFNDDKLRHDITRALERLAHLYVRKKEQAFNDAIHCVQRWLEIDPLSETAHRYLMRLYAQNNQRTIALRQYQVCVELLEKEMGVPPQDETVRLYEAIKANEDVSLDEPVRRLYGSPPPPPELMVGRQQTLDTLKARLGIHMNAPAGVPSRVTVVQGWPGIGKSTLAATIAHSTDIFTAFPDGIFWTSLGQHPNLFAELTHWAQELGDNEIGAVQTLDKAVARVKALLQGQKVLLIVDDIWQIEHASAFRVIGPEGAVLYTTRMNDVARALATRPDDIYRMPILDDEQSLELLGILAETVVQNNPDEARELVHDLEGLPLAIQVAGRLLNAEARLGWGVGDLLSELREGVQLLEAQAPADRYEIAEQTIPTVAVLLQRSTDLLDVQTRSRFAYLGVFAPKPATFEMDALESVWMVDDPRPTVRVLVDRGLLEPVDNGRFQMHALLVMHAKSMFQE